MSEFKEVDDRKFGQQYVLSSSDFSGNNIDAEELANACRRLGISGPLEPLLRDLKKKNDKYTTPSSPAISKESPRKTSQRKDKRSSSNSKTRYSPEFQAFEAFETRGSGGNGSAGGGGGTGGFGKNSYGKESWGRDSGARDLSPEPNMHRMHDTLSAECQPIDTETGGGGTSAMLHLASKVRISHCLTCSFIFVFKYIPNKIAS